MVTGGTTTPRILLVLCLAATAVGLPLRFMNLDVKPYWFDEVITARRIAGVSRHEIRATWSERGDLTPREVRDLFFRQPYRGIVDVARTVAVDAPNHLPLYFLLAHVWTAPWDPSVNVLRGFSAFLGVLALPALFWLCRELFPSRGPAWWPSLSRPSHRTISPSPRRRAPTPCGSWRSSPPAPRSCAPCASPPRARGRSTLLLAVALYTHFLSFLFVPCHAAYVFLTARGKAAKPGGKAAKPLRAFRAFLVAAGSAIALVAPSLVASFRNGGPFEMMDWAFSPMSRLDPLQHWLFHIAFSFFDLGSGSILGPVPYDLLLAPFRYVLLVLAFVVLPLALYGTGAGKLFSTVDRYAIPLFLMVQLIVAWLLGTRVERASGLRRAGWMAGLAAVLAAGLVSCAVYLRAPDWHTKGVVAYVQAAWVLNQERDPLVIVSETSHGGTVAQFLAPGTRMRLIDREERVDLEGVRGPVFFLFTEPRSHLAHGGAAAVQVTRWLWQVVPGAER